MEVSDLNEAIHDFRMLHIDFLQQPIKPFEQFGQKLQIFIVGGNKILMHLAAPRSEGLKTSLVDKLEHANMILTRFRLSSEKSWRPQDLEELKKYLGHYFEDIIKNYLSSTLPGQPGSFEFSRHSV